jgi:hypothetical protein
VKCLREFVESPGGAAQGKSDLQGFAEIKWLQGRLVGEFRMLLAEVADHHTQIGTQRGNAGIIADIEGRQLLSESVAIDTGKNPLRKIVGKAFGKEIMEVSLQCSSPARNSERVIAEVEVLPMRVRYETVKKLNDVCAVSMENPLRR